VFKLFYPDRRSWIYPLAEVALCGSSLKSRGASHHTTAVFTQWIGGRKSNRHSHYRPHCSAHSGTIPTVVTLPSRPILRTRGR
jgi:hypothetical protein